MLKSLSIQNYALIDALSVSFDEGLNILTGETGAGKSIILGALGLVMGKRAEMKSLLDQSKNCIIEANLDISGYDLSDFLRENEIEEDSELVIRRVILKSGKSRAFINDLPVGLKLLETLSSRLIQMHNQFDNLDLADPEYQLEMLDALAGNEKLLSKYQLKFTAWNEAKQELKKLKEKQASFEKEKDFLQFQFDELTETDLDKARDEDIDSTLELLSNAEAIQQALQSSYFSLTEGENTVLDRLNDISRELQHAGGGAQLIEKLVENLQLLTEQMSELSNEMFEQAEKVEFDPARIAELQQLQDQVNKLLLKHKADHVEDLIMLRQRLESKLSNELELGADIQRIESQLSRLEEELNSAAKSLSKSRIKTAGEFCKKVIVQLKDLAMPYANMDSRFEQSAVLGPNGTDEFELLFSANKGREPESIKLVASGGELSRLSLTMKSILAGHMSLPTLIFDEIEAGISGEVALKMGIILRKLAESHQVINITHSAQIASRGQKHFFVYKSHEKDRSLTRIKILDPEEKIIEIAKMLSGDPPTATALKNAEELIHIN